MVIRPFSYVYVDSNKNEQLLEMPGLVFCQNVNNSPKSHESKLRATLDILGHTLDRNGLLYFHTSSILAHVVKKYFPIDAILYGHDHPAGIAIQVSSERGTTLMGGRVVYFVSFADGTSCFVLSDLSNILFADNLSRLTEKQLAINSPVGDWIRGTNLFYRRTTNEEYQERLDDEYQVRLDDEGEEETRDLIDGECIDLRRTDATGVPVW